MAKVLIENSNLTKIADAIRAKNGTATTYKPSEMPAAIAQIRSTLVQKSITENGSYDPADDGADGYSQVTVNVSSGSPVLQSKIATANGVVTPDSGYDGLSHVTVAVVSDDPPRPALPPEYQEVEYVEFDGSSYFFTSTPSVFTIIVDAEQNALNSASLIFGYRGDYSNDFDINFGSTGGDQRWFQRGGFINAGSIHMDGKRVRSRAVLGLATHSGLYVGKYTSTGTSQAFQGKLFKLAFLNSAANCWLMFLVPCYRISDDVVGFYDVVNNVFYTNAGSGTFKKGNDVLVA